MAKPRVGLRPVSQPLPPDTIRLHLAPAGDAATPQRPHLVLLADGQPLLDLPPRHPFFDAARELVRQGNDPRRWLALFSPGGQLLLSGRLGYAAKWTVSESAAGGPRLVEWSEPPAGIWRPKNDAGDDQSH